MSNLWEEYNKKSAGGGSEMEPNEVSICARVEGSKSAQRIGFSANISRRVISKKYLSANLLKTKNKNLLGVRFSTEKPDTASNRFSVGGKDELHKGVCVGQSLGHIKSGRFTVTWEGPIMVIDLSQ